MNASSSSVASDSSFASSSSHSAFDYLLASDRSSSPMNETLEQLSKRLGVGERLVPRSDAFEVDLDVAGYAPEEIRVTVKGRILTIEGQHEARSPDGSTSTSRSFSRSYTLPEGIAREAIQSVLLSDGRTLKIEAPTRFLSSPTPPPTAAAAASHKRR